MAYICTKEKKCKECEHFLYDEENDRMACFAEIDEEVRTKLDAEITEFRKSYEDKTKKEIYNDWYVINFYENYYELLVNNICDIKTDVVRWLNSFRRPLAFLYDEWLSCDDCFSECWDGSTYQESFKTCAEKVKKCISERKDDEQENVQLSLFE